LTDGESHEAAVARLLRELTGLRVKLGAELLTIRHGITRYHVTLTCFEATYAAGEFQSAFYVQGQWVSVTALADYPVGTPQRRLARFLLAPDRQRRLF
jgi:A/G-specific adenine glycosylase